MSKFARVAVVASGVLLGLQGSSRAGLTTILDQIGPNPSDLQSGTPFTSQVFGAPFTRDNIAVIDNFSITSPGTTLTEVDAAVLGFDGFTSGDFNVVTALHVEIYSSVAAAASSLTGDIYNLSATKTDITLTTPYGTNEFSALAQISVSLRLGIGTYYLAVIPSLNYEDTGGAEIGVYASNHGGDSNAYQVNPGGGFDFTDNTDALEVNAAYRILGNVPAVVPEPSSLVMLSTGLALAFSRFRRAWVSRSRDVEEDALDYTKNRR